MRQRRTKMKYTPLYQAHIRHNGKIVEFGGFMLPIYYQEGLIAEHNAVRNKCGLFDVSHMGELELTGKGAFNTIQNLLTNDFNNMQNGECRYSLMCNDNGGIVDDLIVYKFSDVHYLLVVNASNTDKDDAWIQSHLCEETVFKNLSSCYGQLALQGRNAEEILSIIADKDTLPKNHYTFVDNVKVNGTSCLVSKTGYTGEDGFEIYTPTEKTEEIYEKLLEVGQPYGLIPCGLGCRDTLRFEACMPLYGHELNDEYLATEVGLNIFIKLDKDFIGKEALVNKQPKFKRKGVKLLDRGIAREGCLVYDNDGKQIGVVTTGTFSPTFNCALAMVRIEKSYEENEVYIDVRGKKLKAQITKMPFYKHS